ncbi:uncharacterized protein LOC108322699 isoform X3 [Vigna angularis]|uniref:uncharacterized protein LOC108322699 isoform X3 n=1 Tax=Phaseolus angularis TaxID=3914 RepID=UPI0022B3FE5E|nr:uncharacterized protein LOC108322699 isoform X3 [Vigna angularis]
MEKLLSSQNKKVDIRSAVMWIIVYSLISNMRLGSTELIPTPFFSCRRRHFPILQLHIPAGPVPPSRRRNWVVSSSRQKSPIAIYGSVNERTCFDMLCKWLSRLVSFYLLSLNLAAAASDYPTPSTYPCEDISNYYTPVKNLGLTGEALKRQLNSIIAPHHSLSYREKQVWDALKVLDAADVNNPEASSEMYRLAMAFNCLSLILGEHLWPRSYGLTKGPSLTDLHNIRPADANVNSSRGNKYYGECVTSSTKCLRPANKEAAFDTETDKQSWAPPVQVRGDIARALMYMAVCYGFRQPGESPGLQLSDTPNIENREMGLLTTLLKWNEVDPPSREEKLRNERICKFYQHNRNPFVDHPEYANLIWKKAY